MANKAEISNLESKIQAWEFRLNEINSLIESLENSMSDLQEEKLEIDQDIYEAEELLEEYIDE